MFTVDQVIAEHYPSLNDRKVTGPLVKSILRRLLHEQIFVDFGERYPHLQGIDFVSQVLDHFNFSYFVSDSDREKVPASGRLVIIANHPIGSLDGLALLKLIHDIRPDVRIVANDLLMSLKPLQPMLLPVKVLTGGSSTQHIRRINRSLEADESIIMFPSGEVSRLGFSGVKDGTWHQGFLKIARRSKAPILPVHIDGRCSTSFYLTSLLIKPVSTLMLVGQMLHQRKRRIEMTVGSLIPYQSYSRLPIRTKEKAALFKKHLYRIGAGKSPLIDGEELIARPEHRPDLRQALKDSRVIGRTPDDKIIYLYASELHSPVLNEIGRLREVSFRAVGEGTGKKRDLDAYDHYYQHLILWDEEDGEIAGAYRFIDAARTVEERGVEGLYTGSLFNLDTQRTFFLDQGLEVGRSFVQPRYWGRRSLDYLWYGIGAYLVENPDYRFLFGSVSISNAVPQLAKELLIFFYKTYFSPPADLRCSRNPFSFSRPLGEIEHEFCKTDYRADFRKLKSLLANLGASIPPLYKQYTELCKPGGVVFLDFNVDPDFNNCIDGLVIVDIKKLRDAKRKRYMEQTILV